MNEPNKELRPVGERLQELIKMAKAHDQERWEIGSPRASDCNWCDIVLLVEALTAEREHWQELLAQKLSAVSVASISNTHKSMEDTKIERDNQFWSVAYEDVRTAIKREIELREKLEHWLEVVGELEEALKPFVDSYDRYGNHGHFSHGVYMKAIQALSDLEAVKGRK